MGFIEALPALETPQDLSVSFVFIAVINLPDLASWKGGREEERRFPA